MKTVESTAIFMYICCQFYLPALIQQKQPIFVFTVSPIPCIKLSGFIVLFRLMFHLTRCLLRSHFPLMSTFSSAPITFSLWLKIQFVQLLRQSIPPHQQRLNDKHRGVNLNVQLRTSYVFLGMVHEPHTIFCKNWLLLLCSDLASCLLHCVI